MSEGKCSYETYEYECLSKKLASAELLARERESHLKGQIEKLREENAKLLKQIQELSHLEERLQTMRDSTEARIQQLHEEYQAQIDALMACTMLGSE
jgi:FtsZ-binding cell division protein ZapB